MMIRIKLAFGFAILFLTGAAAAREPAPNPTDRIYACAALPEDMVRLACFDDAVGALRSKEEAGLVQTIDIAMIETIEREAFGFSMPSLPKLFSRAASGKTLAEREEVEEISVAIESARLQSVTGRAIVTLENGQTWEQIDTTKIQSSSLRKAKQARVRKAALGSFMMALDDGRSFRVKRAN